MVLEASQGDTEVLLGSAPLALSSSQSGHILCISERMSASEASVDVASATGCSWLGSSSAGGVPLRDPLELVQGLIGCGLSGERAASLVDTYYAKVVVAEVDVGSTVSVSSRKSKSAAREREWAGKMGLLPLANGQCYLHPVRFGKRVAYLDKLGKAPNMRDFVAALEPGDLNERVATEIGVYRIPAPGLEVVYHLAYSCDEGERIGTFAEVLAGFLHSYPMVNKRYVCEGVGVAVPMVGVIGMETHGGRSQRGDVIAVHSVEHNARSSVGNVGDVVRSVDGARLLLDSAWVKQEVQRLRDLQDQRSRGGADYVGLGLTPAQCEKQAIAAYVRDTGDLMLDIAEARRHVSVSSSVSQEHVLLSRQQAEDNVDTNLIYAMPHGSVKHCNDMSCNGVTRGMPRVLSFPSLIKVSAYTGFRFDGNSMVAVDRNAVVLLPAGCVVTTVWERVDVQVLSVEDFDYLLNRIFGRYGSAGVLVKDSELWWDAVPDWSRPMKHGLNELIGGTYYLPSASVPQIFLVDGGHFDVGPLTLDREGACTVFHDADSPRFATYTVVGALATSVRVLFPSLDDVQ